MQFRLSTLFLLFVVLGSSLAVFGGVGIVVFVFVVLLAISIVRSIWLLLFLGFTLLLCLQLLPTGARLREAARRAACENNLQQIALALHNYRDANGCFPPAYVSDKEGRPTHSWRVLLLPYLEEDALYKQYSFNEPWDGPNNKKVLATQPSIYACPSDDTVRAPGQTRTNYVAVVGADAAWSGSESKNLTGDLSTTVMLVEVADASIAWTEPNDLSLDALVSSSPESLTVSSKHFPDDEFFTYSHNPGANVACADGHVAFLPSGLLAYDKFPDVLKVGGCPERYRFVPRGYVGRRIHWRNCTALAIWLASTGWLFVRAVRSRKKAVPLAQPSSTATSFPQSGGE